MQTTATCLTNAPMNDLIDDFLQTDAVGSLLAVPPQDSFHVVQIDDDSRLTGIERVADMDMRINGGYFMLRREIFDYLHPGDDLVTDTFVRAARAEKFRAVRFDGFWAPMDTLKERAALEDDASKWEPSLGIVGVVVRSRIRGVASRCGPCRYQLIRLMLRDQSARRICCRI